MHGRGFDPGLGGFVQVFVAQDQRRLAVGVQHEQRFLKAGEIPD